jgi:hypothetical protein
VATQTATRVGVGSRMAPTMHRSSSWPPGPSAPPLPEDGTPTPGPDLDPAQVLVLVLVLVVVCLDLDPVLGPGLDPGPVCPRCLRQLPGGSRSQR